jgi:hypothetical protein
MDDMDGRSVGHVPAGCFPRPYSIGVIRSALISAPLAGTMADMVGVADTFLVVAAICAGIASDKCLDLVRLQNSPEPKPLQFARLYRRYAVAPPMATPNRTGVLVAATIAAAPLAAAGTADAAPARAAPTEFAVTAGPD